MIGPGGGVDRVYAFGLFVADPAEGTLHHNGVLVGLSQKSFEVLIILIERRDRIVRKTELLELVWPETFVEENNLARHVSILRKALGDHAHGSEYIRTIAGRGYMFVAPVTETSRASLTKPAAATATPASPPPPRHWRLGLIGLTAAAMAGLAVFALRGGADPRTPVSPDRKLWQVTTGGGLDTDAAWSIDSQRIVYASDRDGNFDIWVQALGEDRAQKLTSSPSHDWQPTWPTRGQHIAFRSERDGGGIFMVPTTGGDERRLTSFGYEPQWSPHGSQVLFYDSRIGSRLYLVNADGTGLRRVLDEFLQRFRSFRAAWHPDGRVSVYGNHKILGWSFWTASLDGGEPVQSAIDEGVRERFESMGLSFVDFTWAPGGDVLYLEGRAQDVVNIWRVGVDRETLEWQDGPDRLTLGSGSDTSIAVSPDGSKLTFTARHERTRLWSFPVDGTQARLTGPGQPMAGPAVNAVYPDVPPDGTAIVYRVSRRGNQELWRQSFVDGSHQKLATAKELFTPRWSTDGTTVAYRRPVNDGRQSVVSLVSARNGGERPLTSASLKFIAPCDWSADGQWILGTCEHGTSGLRSLCLLPVSHAPRAETAMQIIASDPARDLYQGRFSPNQRWIAFQATSRATSSSIYVMSRQGGDWIQISEGSSWDDKPRWSSDGGTLYFVSNRTGFLDVWAQNFNPDEGKPVGAPYRITKFESPREQILSPMLTLELAVAPNRLILPIVEASGNVWILENVR